MLKHHSVARRAMYAASFLALITLQTASDSYSAAHGVVHTIYVQPTGSNATSCSYEPCETLANYLKNPSRYFQSNTSVMFLDGRHSIYTEGLIPIQDVSNLEFWAVNFAAVSCKSSTGFAFLNVSNLSISNIVFYSCGARIGEIILKQVLHVYTNASQLFCMSERQQVAILLAGVFNLTLSSFTLEKSTGYGLLAFNVLGVSVIRYSKFFGNNLYTVSSKVCLMSVLSQNFEIVQDCLGGNALFIFSEPTECKNNQTHILLIENSIFTYGVDLTGITQKLEHCPNDNAVFGGAGISAKIAPTSYKLEIILDGVQSSANNADSGPNMNFQTFDFVQHFTLTIQSSICELGNTLLSEELIEIMWPLNSGFFYQKGLKLSSSYKPVCWIHTPETSYESHMNIAYSLFSGY